MVQSASVEDDMDKHQQLVPIAEIIPDIESETQRSVANPFPPPLLPDTEDFSPSSISDTSSGYMSTSISTMTLSDVYTLSWDLPASSSSRGGVFETVPDDDDDDDDVEKMTKDLPLDQSEPEESVIGLKDEAAERMDQKPFKANDPLDHPEKRQPPSVHLKEPDQNSVTGCAGSEPPDISETRVHSVVESLHENSTEAPQLDGTSKRECEAVPHGDEQTSNPVRDDPLDFDAPPQPNSYHTASDHTQPAPESNGVSALQISPDKLSSDTSDPVGTSVLPSVTDETQQVAPSDPSTAAPLKVQPPKSGSSAANPFKIQKVKSSDLKSFQRMVGEEGGKAAAGDPASSLGSGLNLSVPLESLEMISDSEEADEGASVVLPDWLKEGEFVTVGTNKSGTVRYVGPADFAAGTWVGVELEVPAGKNDGSVGGKHYFHCNPGYGVLVRPNRVARGGAKRRRQQQKRQSANLSGSSPNLAALTALAKGEAGSAGRSKGENRKSWNP